MLIVQPRIPKTATTSIEAVLKRMRNNGAIQYKSHGHAKTNLICNRYPKEKWKNAIVVTSIRNPYDRLVSAYQYIIQFKKDKRNKELKYVFDYPSFKDFAMDIPKIFEKNQFFHPQCRWIYREDDHQWIDYLIRYESLSADWIGFIEKYNLPKINLPIQRKTKRKKWQSYYDKETKKVVYHLYQEDFRRLNYVN